jgi:cytochrome c biogenesis protein CcmG/thiol:disulfide interchange protein DsbE
MADAPVVSSRRSVRPWIAGLIGVAAFVGLLAFGLRRDPREIPSPLVGRPAPSFAMTLFDGSPFSTGAYRGKIMMVNFWASWCYPACYIEAPHLQRIWERYRDDGVVMIGVNIQDREVLARAFIRRFDLTFPNGMDATGRISIDYGIYGVPETFLIDRAGRIVYKHVGAATEDIFVPRIEALLQGRPNGP